MNAQHTREERRRVLLVLGMHNSGTSLLANAARLLGADLGPDILTRGGADNPAAYDYWENACVVAIHEELLRRLDRHWSACTGSFPLPPTVWASPAVVQARVALTGYVRDQLEQTDSLWGVKDPRTARLLPMWRDILADVGAEPLYLIATRPPGPTMASFGAKAGVPANWAEALWWRTYAEILEGTPAASRVIVDFEEWFDTPDAAARRVAALLGSDADRVIEAMQAVRADVSAFRRRSTTASARCQALYALCGAAAGRDVSGDVARLKEGMDRPLPGLDWSAGAGGVPESGLAADSMAPIPRPLTVGIVTAELAGLGMGGGIGTAMSALALTLADAGHAVTVLHLRPAENADSAMREHYRRRGVVVESLPAAPPANPVLAWVRLRGFDVVYHHDWLGVGASLGPARLRDPALAGTTLVCVAHGPSGWVRQANGIAAASGTPDPVEARERASVASADALISPSAYLIGWMRKHGWILPPRVLVQQNLYPLHPEPGGIPDERVVADELVFYGRLEARKGVVLFCDALDRLEPRDPPVAVTFLGPSTAGIDGDAAAYVQRRAAGRPWRVLDQLDRTAALAFLRGGRRVAVVPSLLENSPYTVLECLLEGIPILASRTGGIPELIADADHAEALFDPDPPALAARLGQALQTGVRRARPRVHPLANRADWLAWNDRLPRRTASAAAWPAIVEAGVSNAPPLPGNRLPPSTEIPGNAKALVLWMRVRNTDPDDVLRFHVTAPGGHALLQGERLIGHAQGEWGVFDGRQCPSDGWPSGPCWAEWSILSPRTGWSAALARWITIHPVPADGASR